MSLTLADFVFETSQTQGTGALNLDGAATGFQTFVAGAGDGAQVPYVISDATDWEVGIGTITAGSPDTLSRDTVRDSSNSGSAVNWGPGTRNVILNVPSSERPMISANNAFTGNNTFSGDITFSGKVSFADDGELTIASGAITVTGSNHTLDTESNAATDDLDTINGGVDGMELTLRIENNAREVVVKDGTGNIEAPNGEDITLTSNENAIKLIFDAALSKWLIVSGSVSKSSAPTKSYISAGSGNYIAPVGCTKFTGRISGGGGGGGGYTSGSGANGGATSFNGITAAGGEGGGTGFTTYANPGNGGTGGSGAAQRFPGNAGGTAGLYIGGTGGAHPFFGGAGCPHVSNSNSGGRNGSNGGGGAGARTNTNGSIGGHGGGSGEAVEFTIDNPSGSYAYSIGSGGAGATNATNGGNGFIEITEYYS